LRTVPQEITVCPIAELPPGTMRLVEWEDLEIGVFNCGGTVYAIEDRCSHDDGPLVEGELDEDTCTVECPRHGSRFDLKTGKPITLPAYTPVETFPVRLADDLIKLEVD
jgi:3-phenylpropionate/trans-cinnamate dioxygenase ferredoxin component